MKLSRKHGSGGLSIALLGLLCGSAARADTIFVTNFFSNNGTGVVGEYTTSGATVNAALIVVPPNPISGETTLSGLALSGSDLFVTQLGPLKTGEPNGVIGVYTTSGATVNSSFSEDLNGSAPPSNIGVAASGSNVFVTSLSAGGSGAAPAFVNEYTTSGVLVGGFQIFGSPILNSAIPVGVAVSGSDVFVVRFDTGTVGEYTTSGTTVNASLISGLDGPDAIAISGSDLFIANASDGTIGEYTTSGATVNASLISGLDFPGGIAVDGSNLFVTNFGNSTIGEYTTSGATVNAALITGLDEPVGIAVTSVPEPGTFTLLGLGLAGLAFWK